MKKEIEKSIIKKVLTSGLFKTSEVIYILSKINKGKLNEKTKK